MYSNHYYNRKAPILLILIIFIIPQILFAQTPGAMKWAFTTGEFILGSPAIGSDGAVYVGSDRKFYAINPNGTQKWAVSKEYGSAAIGSDGTVYVGSDKLYAINTNGTQKWAFSTVNRCSSPAIGSDGTVYVGSNQLYAINPDGTQKWVFFTTGISLSEPTIGSDGTIYIGSSDDKLYAINPDGTQKWASNSGGNAASSPAIAADGTIYSGSGTYTSSSGGTMIPNDSKIYAFNRNGTQKWSFSTEGIVYASPAIGNDGTIYIGSADGKFYAINPNGTKKWDFNTGAEIFSSAAIGLDGTIYVGSWDYKLYAINPDGTQKWMFVTGHRIFSSPAIGADGTVYVGSVDGKFYAIFSTSMGLAQSPWPKYQQNNQNTGRSEITISNEIPFLYGGKVIPKSGHEQTEYIFQVSFSDSDNDAPSYVMIKIDNDESVRMSKKDNTTDYINGEIYEYRTELAVGTHSYSFSASDGIAVAKGDIKTHAEPTVSGSNSVPLLFNANVYPVTGNPSTNFCFSVIYTDSDNDSCSEIFLKIDDMPIVLMEAENQNDKDYTDGIIYQYRTKLSLGAHTFAFSAKDWASDANGDITIHNGPDVVLSDADPILINGSVIPQIGSADTVFTFSVQFINKDGLPPSLINVKIDNEIFPLTPVEGSLDFITGVTYYYRTKLGIGDHSYRFFGEIGENIANGDTAIHSGPIVGELSSELPLFIGKWAGKTSQGYPVTFSISENRNEVLDFQSIVFVDGSITINNNTTYRSEELNTQINKVSISNNGFNGGQSFDHGSAHFSGSFNSPIKITGTFDGLYVTLVWIGYQYNLSLSGSGTWQASLLSSIVIENPPNRSLVTTPTIQVTGSASGVLVKTAVLTDCADSTPVIGAFSVNVTLTEGENAITLIAYDDNANIVGSHSIFVTLDSKPPLVVITEPSNNQTIDRPDVNIRGTVNDPSILSINVNEIIVNVINGQFNTVVSLKSGLNKIVALSYDKAGNRGSDTVTVNCTSVVGVDETTEEFLPLAYKISQNYPNPFNSSTTIKYQLPKNDYVTLKIYNTIGQQIKVIVDQNQPAGYYSLNWNGTDEQGENVSSGLYFICLKTKEFIKTNKMVILK